MREHTYREYLDWLEWLDQQWNKPTLTHHYLMQIAQEVRRVLAKKPAKILLSHFKIKFERKTNQQEKPKSDSMVGYTKALWKMAVGLLKPKGQDRGSRSRNPSNKADRRRSGNDEEAK